MTHTQEVRRVMRKLLKVDEGRVLHPYVDSKGWLTIGYGHNLGVWAPPEVWQQVTLPSRPNITIDEAEYILDTDIVHALQEVHQSLMNFIFDMHPVRVAVLGCMAFQMGGAGFRTFKRMLTAISVGSVKDTVREMLDSKWAREFEHRSRKYAHLYQWPEEESNG